MNDKKKVKQPAWEVTYVDPHVRKLVTALTEAPERIAKLEAEISKLIQAKNNGSRYLWLIHENAMLKDQVTDLEALRDKLLARIANLESAIRGLGVA